MIHRSFLLAKGNTAIDEVRAAAAKALAAKGYEPVLKPPGAPGLVVGETGRQSDP